MEYRRLGKSGLPVSLLSFGSWVTFGPQVQTDLAYTLMKQAYDAGINFFDNAEVYSDGESEKIMGQALKKLGWGRDTFIVSSKVFWGGDLPTQQGLSRKHVFDACHAALRRLQVEYLDLYFCHRPDVQTPIEETVWAMNDLMRQGKILYWGTSEWTAQQITEAHVFARANSLIGPTMEQPEYNLFNRAKVEGDYLPLYDTFGLGTTTWSPLASGVLTGKYNDGVPKGSRFDVPGYEWLRARYDTPDGRQRLEKAKAFSSLAVEMSVKPAELAIAWCASNPRVSTVILGASKPEQLTQNLKALEVLPKMTPEVHTRIEKIFANKPEGPKDYR